MNNLITLLTPTGGRPHAFRLLERYVAAQTYQWATEWIVIDDGTRPTTVYSGQKVIRRQPFWREGGGPTLAQNLAAGLEAAAGDRILVLEDDECYLPEYIAEMAASLEGHALAGQAPAFYYNVASRRYRVLANESHASLCQTGFRREVIPDLLRLLEARSPFVDIPLWQHFGTAGLRHDRRDVVSMKGMPGRPGIGAGHRPSGSAWSADPSCRVLQSWIGDRYLSYLRYYRAPEAALTVA